MIAILKPHIQRAQPADGNGWACFGGPGNWDTAFGRTPDEAYSAAQSRYWQKLAEFPSGGFFRTRPGTQ